MKVIKIVAIFAFFLIIFACATIPVVQQGTVLEKFARGGYVEISALNIQDQWMPIPIGHAPTYWVSVQGNGCRIEVPMNKEQWDKVQIGDLITLYKDRGGGA